MLSKSDSLKELQLVSCFARRQKTNYIGSDHGKIIFRYNHLEQSSFLAEYGMGTMAASLIGTQFEESGFGVNCQGFKILNKSFPLQTKVKSFEINGKEMEIIDNEFIDLLDKNELLCILKEAKYFSCVDIIDTINEWYEEYRNIFGQYPGQNPIVIAYKFKK